MIGSHRHATASDSAVVATTTLAEDDALVPVATAAGAQVFRGSAADVLARYLGAANASHAQVVVRLTADCPLLDPAVIDAVVEGLLTSPGCDYASNTHTRTFPRGLDVEAMPMATLERLAVIARNLIPFGVSITCLHAWGIRSRWPAPRFFC